MARWYPLESADADFIASAPLRYHYRLRCAAPPERVWESLASDPSLSAWGPAVKAVTWFDPRPFGVGTTREVVLAGGLAKVHERFFRWDEGRGYSFLVYEAGAPAFRRFAEDYVIEPDGDGAVLDWTVALEPRGAFTLPLRALSPVTKLLFGRMAADGTKYFARG